jgi:hypothetical protein
MDRTPAERPEPPATTSRGVAQCLVIGLACGIAVPLLVWIFGLGRWGLLLFPLAGLAVGVAIGRSVRIIPRNAGVAFLGGAAVWAVISAGGGLLWPLRVIFGLAVAMVAAAAFATGVAWRQPRSKALPPS